MIQIFKDKYEASQYLENYANEHNLSLFDAIIDFCEKRDIDVDDIEKYLTSTLKEKIIFQYNVSEGIKISNIEDML